MTVPGSEARARRVNDSRLAARRAEFRARAHSTARVRTLLGGVSDQAVASRVADHALLALEMDGQLHFPDWQFGSEGPYPGLRSLIGALLDGGRGPLAADAVVRSPVPEEDGRTPAQMLAAGETELAVHYVSVAGGGV